MGLLMSGLVLWIGVHLMPSVTPQLRKALMVKLGDNGYKGFFSLAIISALLLIVFGWRSSEPQFIYDLGPSVRHIAMLMLVFAIFLFIAARQKTRLKRLIRHPQLSGVLIWAAAHLLLNGDTRSLVLFAGMAVWSIVEMLLINRREGVWIKPQRPPLAHEVVYVVVAVGVLFAAVFFHQHLSGVAILSS